MQCMEYRASLGGQGNLFIKAMVDFNTFECTQGQCEVQVDDLIHPAEKASSRAKWDAVALACCLVAHCLCRKEAGWACGRRKMGAYFFRSPSRWGGQEQGPWFARPPHPLPDVHAKW